ncbi:MAG: DUF1549 domain-containing protein [Bryobacteraceae bacterium]
MKLLAAMFLAAMLCAAGAPNSKKEAGAADPGKNAAHSDSGMTADAHAPLFQPPKSREAGRITERVAAALPKVEAPSAPVPRRNFIDRHIFGKMEKDGVPHAPLSTDQEFLRRVTLDLTGRIPLPSQFREFIADPSPDKRERLVAELIGSDAFVDKWSYFIMEILRANGKMGRAHELFHYVLKESLAADRPYDDLVRSIIAASAKSNYVVAASNPIVREHVEGRPGQVEHGDDLSKVHQLDTHDELTILFGKTFLGINLSCISCHDGKAHLEKVNVYLTGKKRSDFFQQAAFMGWTRYIPHVERTEAIMGHFIVDDLGPGYDTKGESMLRIKRFGGPSSPKFILTDEIANPDAHPRDELGRMLTADPQFARATVNLFWSKMMGFGIVEPWDEFDLARLDPNNVPEGWEVQPTHPELLNELATWFRENDYSLHKLFTLICNSSAYQLSARFPGEWSDNYTKYYARKFARMLTAEELHDAIATATGRPGNFKAGKETVQMAMQMSVPRSSGDLKSFMQAFGQSNRGAPPRPPSPSPLQPIMLMQSPVVGERVLAEKDSRVQRLLDSYKDDGKVVEELFLATLSRMPSEAERSISIAALERDRAQGAQNLHWALLNLVEFLYNF